MEKTVLEKLNKVAIHCQTEEEAKKCLNIAEQLGLTWKSGENFTSITYWRYHKENTCYCFVEGIFEDNDWLGENGYSIKTPEWFLKNFIPNKELKQWLLKKWLKDNHKKYHKYFDEWYSYITASQLEGFRKQMFNDKNNILGR